MWGWYSSIGKSYTIVENLRTFYTVGMNVYGWWPIRFTKRSFVTVPVSTFMMACLLIISLTHVSSFSLPKSTGHERKWSVYQHFWHSFILHQIITVYVWTTRVCNYVWTCVWPVYQQVGSGTERGSRRPLPQGSQVGRAGQDKGRGRSRWRGQMWATFTVPLRGARERRGRRWENRTTREGQWRRG